MRPTSIRPARPLEVLRQVERLSGLPIRPASARAAVDALAAVDPATEPEPTPSHPSTELDPGWVLARLRDDRAGPASIVAEQPWWSVKTGAGAEAIGRLWRHSVAVSLASRRLAREANDPDPGRAGRAGLLHRLGLWALGAVDPERLAYWISSTDPARRREQEILWFGTGIDSVGRTLSGRWGCDALMGDSSWLYADLAGELAGCADAPGHLTIIRAAHALAEKTPWALDGPPIRDPGPLDPRVRILIAEVQARCGADFLDPEPDPREERLTRENASLRLELARLRADRDAQNRLIVALGASEPTERPEVWAERAGLAWCDSPGVAAAKVIWRDPTSTTEPAIDPGPHAPRPASQVLPIGPGRHPCAEVHLWTVDPVPDDWPGLEAWGSWAALVADRTRLRRKLDAATDAFRRRVAAEETSRSQAKLDALAEFAAGAGHELNNPLAVILGRAQLLLTKEDDPATGRSLRTIIAQAQRAHRILRDLMYVARPPESRLRACSPDEILRAAVRDAQAEAEARGIRLIGDPRPSTSAKAWADPDALRHVADVFLRNALEATAGGGSVFITSTGEAPALRWIVKDSGRGLGSHEAAHLFDPFYCGREAGRGLGIGLPRAARIVERASGEISWQSTPGQGTSFQVKLPLACPPTPPAPGEVGPPTATRIERARSA